MKIRKFDTRVQHLKYKVLREVAREAWNDTLTENMMDIPKTIVPRDEATMRCCVYKERAIAGERVKIAMGGDKKSPHVIEVIDIACDECPMSGYEVTQMCRGCLSHRCQDVCRKDAIYVDEQHRAHIDKEKCVNCGLCAGACPYGAIIDFVRPCVRACKAKAISMDDQRAAQINYDKCTSCGACVYQCPFGAITDKSFILEVVDMIKKSENNKNYKMVAVVAPSIASQFTYAKLGQVLQGIKALGFDRIVEAALGADSVAFKESRELQEKGFLLSSCCPAFVEFVHNEFPDMVPFLSHNVSPGAEITRLIKKNDPDCKVVFIGPCTAKKAEYQKEELQGVVDTVITFEELQALFDSCDIDITTLPEDELDTASFYGRIFARSGGLSEAMVQGFKEHGYGDMEVKAVPCAGLDECRTALMKARRKVLDGNFIEGMACVEGCIGGAGCLSHGGKNRAVIDKYGKEAGDRTIVDAVQSLQ